MKIGVAVLFLCFMGQMCPKASAQVDEIKKEWSFPSPAGGLKVSARSFPTNGGPRVTRLEITPDIRGSWSVPAEARALDSVLSDLPKAGFSLDSLGSISLRLNEGDAQARLASYVATHSLTWRSSLKNVAKLYPLTASFLNESGAYREWVAVFSKHGLTLRAVGVEEVVLAKFSKSGAVCPTGIDCVNLIVPKDALIQMNIDPVAH